MLDLRSIIIKSSKLHNKYADLIVDNCLCNKKKSCSNVDIVLNDSDLKSTLYNLIIYGNLVSKTNKKINTHSQLQSFEEYNKYLTSIELEKFQRNYFYLDKILIILLILNFFTFYSVIL